MAKHDACLTFSLADFHAAAPLGSAQSNEGTFGVFLLELGTGSQ